MVATSRQIDGSLSDSISYDPEESNITTRDTGVLQTIIEEGLTVFTFDGLKRLTGLHQEKLSRIIDRLEEEGLLEKVDEGYRITARGNETIPRRLNTGLQPIPIVQSLLPRDVDLQQIISGLKGRWFGGLRWLGYSQNEDATTLKWIAEEDGIQIDARFTDNDLSIDAKVAEGREVSQAVKAAHQLLGHVSGLYGTPTRRRQKLASQIAYYPGMDFA
jgi:DNA-binding PadR family transcriptional regulator